MDKCTLLGDGVCLGAGDGGGIICQESSMYTADYACGRRGDWREVTAAKGAWKVRAV